MSADESVEIPIRLKQDVDTEAAKAAAGLKGLAAGFDKAGAAGDKLASVKMPSIVKDGARLKMLAKEADAAAASLLKMGQAKESAERAGAAAAARAAKADEAERKQKLAISLAVQAMADKTAAKEAAAAAVAAKARGAREASAMAAGMAALNGSSKGADAATAAVVKREAAAAAEGVAALQKASKEADAIRAHDAAAADKARGAREAAAMALGMSSLNNSTKDANTDRANATKREAEAMAAGLDALKNASKEADAIRVADEASAAAHAAKLAKIDEAAYQKAVAREARQDKAKAKLAESAYEKAVAAANKTPDALKAKGADPKISGFQKLLQFTERAFGTKAAGGVVQGGKALASVGDAWGKLGPIGQTLIKGGASIAFGAAALAAASAVLLVAGAMKGAIAIGKLSLEQSELKKSAVASLDRLTKGAGGETYAVAIKLAADLNLDRDDTVARVKALLQAGVSKEQIPLAIKAIADVSADVGDEKGNSLKDKISEISRRGKFDQGAVDSMAEAGVKAADVMDALKKKGESTTAVMARLKTNQVSAAEGIKAVIAAAEKGSGGAAAKAGESIGGLLNAIKIKVLDLFADVDTGPLKEVLKTVKELFEGEKGAKLKTEITGLGNAIFGVFKSLNTPEGKKALSEAFDKAAEAASNAAVVVSAFDRGITALGNNGGFAALGVAVDLLLGPLKTAADLVKVINAVTGGSATGSASSALVAAPANDNASAVASATAAGGDIAGGMAAGVTAGGPEIAAAVTAAAQDAVNAAKVALGIHSPSKVFAGLGRYSALGLAQGMNDNAGTVASAGASMAGASVGGAASGLAGGAGASSGGNVYHFSPAISLPPGSTAETKAAAEAGVRAAYPEWLEMQRRFERDRGERGAA